MAQCIWRPIPDSPTAAGIAAFLRIEFFGGAPRARRNTSRSPLIQLDWGAGEAVERRSKPEEGGETDSETQFPS